MLPLQKTLPEWFDYIEQRYQYFHGGTEDSLPRLRQLAKKLDIIFSCPVITVTGTNGKGSTVVFTESILLAANYHVGSYLSPHLLKFNERIRLNGQEVDDTSLCLAFAAVDKVCTEDTTYFEFTTLAAFYLFKQQPIDVLILEVGLGGRLDAVNIIDTDIAVITAVALEHVEQLGNTREKIGYEKSGIMRLHKPLVYGEENPPQSITSRVKQLSSPLYCLAKDFSFSQKNNSWSFYSSLGDLFNLPLPKLSLNNAAVALMVVKLLSSKLTISEKAICEGLEKAFLPGRFQKIGQDPEIIIDVAHNPHAAAFLAKQLQPIKGKTNAVFGILKDKDISGVLLALRDKIDVWYLGGLDMVTTRGTNINDLRKLFAEFNIKMCYTHATIKEAYRHAIVNSVAADRIVAFGSFYTVNEILEEKKSGNKN